MVPMAPSMTAMRSRRSAARACPRSVPFGIRCSLPARPLGVPPYDGLARGTRSRALFVRAFRQQALVHHARMVVRAAGRFPLGLADPRRLLGPALVDGGQAPARAPARSADGP